MRGSSCTVARYREGGKGTIPLCNPNLLVSKGEPLVLSAQNPREAFLRMQKVGNDKKRRVWAAAQLYSKFTRHC